MDCKCNINDSSNNVNDNEVHRVACDKNKGCAPLREMGAPLKEADAGNDEGYVRLSREDYSFLLKQIEMVRSLNAELENEKGRNRHLMDKMNGLLDDLALINSATSSALIRVKRAILGED